MLLSIRPFPKQAESVDGYKLRLAVANGWDSYPNFARAAEIPLHDYFLKPLTGHGERLDDLGLSEEFSAIQSADKARVYQDLKLAQVRICPTCLDKGHVHKAEWDFLPFTHCSTHGDELLHACPSCHSPIRLTSTLLENYCACGTHFKSERNIGGAPEAWLAHFLSLDEALRDAFIRDLTYAMQRAARPFDSMFSQRRIPPRQHQSWAEIVSRAYRFLSDKRTILGWIGNCYEARADLATLGEKTQILPITTLIQRLELDWPIKTVFERHATNRDYAHTMHAIALPDDPQRFASNQSNEDPDTLCQRQVDKNDFADVLDIDPPSVTTLFERGLVQPQRLVSQIRYAHFDLGKITRFMNKLTKAEATTNNVPISELEAALPLFAASWADLLGPVLQNDLRAERRDAETEVASAVVVDRGEAMTTLYNVFRRRAWDRLDNLTQDETRKVLCISRSEFKSLAENGILAPMPWHTKSDRYRVKDVVHALLNFVFLGRWCAINNVSTLEAEKRLESEGFEAVCHSTFAKSPELVATLKRLMPSGHL